MKRLILVGACALALTACASVPGAPPPSYHAQAEKVLLTAEGAFNVGAKTQLAICGRPVPLMPRSAKCLKGDDLRHQGLKLLRVARTAYNGGAMPGTASLLALAAQLTTMFPKEP